METIIILALIFINGITVGYYRKKLNDKNRKDYQKKICVCQGRCSSKEVKCKESDHYCAYQRNANF